MTKLRRHIPGQIVHLNRRCFQRFFLIRPDKWINHVIAYELARYSSEHGQVVHAFMAMSNHIHQISTDTTGERSAFMRDAMREISKARNHDLRREDSLWDNRPFGDTVLLGRETIEQQLLYVWLNPVAAGLVDRVEHWPGFMILPRHWGKTIRIKKPGKYYGRGSDDVVEFTPMPPPGYENMSLEEVREHFEELLRKAEERMRKKRRRKRILGVYGVLKTCPFSCPRTPSKRGTLRPRFASKNRELLSRAIALYHQFQETYQRQRLKWLSGKRVTFPCGTVQLRHCAPIRCEPPDPDEPGLVTLYCRAA